MELEDLEIIKIEGGPGRTVCVFNNNYVYYCYGTCTSVIASSLI